MPEASRTVVPVKKSYVFCQSVAFATAEAILAKRQTTTMQPIIDQTSAVTPLLCEHRFDVVGMDGQFILDLWECRYGV